MFRIGHLGNSDELMMASALAGAEMAMMDAGVKITPGSGISKAIEYWQKTSKVRGRALALRFVVLFYRCVVGLQCRTANFRGPAAEANLSASHAGHQDPRDHLNGG